MIVHVVDRPHKFLVESLVSSLEMNLFVFLLYRTVKIQVWVRSAQVFSRH